MYINIRPRVFQIQLSFYVKFCENGFYKIVQLSNDLTKISLQYIEFNFIFTMQKISVSWWRYLIYKISSVQVQTYYIYVVHLFRLRSLCHSSSRFAVIESLTYAPVAALSSIFMLNVLGLYQSSIGARSTLWWPVHGKQPSEAVDVDDDIRWFSAVSHYSSSLVVCRGAVATISAGAA